MKDTEFRSAVVTDHDPYLAAYHAQAKERTMRQRLAADGDVPTEYFVDWGAHAQERHNPDVAWQECDSHLQGVLERQGVAATAAHDLATAAHELGINPDDARDSHGRTVADWRRERDRAQREVRMLERLGEDVPADLRAQADEPDFGQAVTDLADAMRHRSRGAWINAKAGLPS